MISVPSGRLRIPPAGMLPSFFLMETTSNSSGPVYGGAAEGVCAAADEARTVSTAKARRNIAGDYRVREPRPLPALRRGDWGPGIGRFSTQAMLTHAGRP